MAEPVFGPASQFWPAMPGPAYGFMQSPMPLGSRPLQGATLFGGNPGMVQTPNPTGADPYMMSNMGNPTANVSTGLSAAIIPGPIGSFPTFTGTEIAIGVTAPALLTAVAMRRGQPLGPTNDQEIEDFIYDALDLLPGASDVEVRCENGKATVTGTVPHKRLKRDVGEVAWAIPALNDVQNNITVAARRRSRSPQQQNEPAPGRNKP
jgi:BON domain